MLRCLLFLSLCQLSLVAEVSAQNPSQKIDFDRQIKPIMSDRCYTCHGPDSKTRVADLRLDILADAEYVLEPGEPDESELIRRLESDDIDEQMPPPDSNLTVSESEIELIRQWIKEGAEWEPHWSFVAPVLPTVPQLKDASQVKNEIDRFVLAKLEQNNLTLAVPANKEKVLRRVTFDLTGLSPTLAELDAFLADQSPDAYENVVDRLLASPRFGERMTSDWLDLARYSDTYGYQVDRDRFVWPWRDWVIGAFNANKPFDEFAIEQLAGDLLPGATDDQILATTFNRLHPQKVEGGSVEEEFRVEYVADRTQTFGMAFLGLTIECARCHDHKFDPISQREYYQLFSFFNNIDEAGLYSYFDAEAVPTPSMLQMDDQQKKQLAVLQSAAATAETAVQVAFDRCTTADPESVFQTWLADLDARAALAEKPLLNPVHEVDFNVVEFAANERIETPEGQVGVKLTGDDQVRIDAGKFSRDQPFSIAARINVPISVDDTPIDRNVIFHRSAAWTDSASRGYQLLIEDGRLSASLIHFWPGNAISVRTLKKVPTGEWTQVTMTYDGSSRASGLNIFVDGKRQPVEVVRDDLRKTIRGSSADHLVIGARMRDRGFTNGQVTDFKVFDRELTEIETAQLDDGNSLRKLLKMPAEQLLVDQRNQLRAYFASNHCEEIQTRLTSLREKRTLLTEFHDRQREIMVMQEMVHPRPAYILDRGAYDAPSDPVIANTPALFPALKIADGRVANRLDLARWLVSGKHPLTARVAVNHYWQLMFGFGIVRTPEDFGSQGAVPTHPELLDWLAVDFQSDWDVKRCLKQMVMSATYQQSSAATNDLRQLDPNNELLGRVSSFRLPAEMLRDNVLFQSGLLVDKMGGPPVKPYEVAVAFSPVQPDSGEGLYRRSLYTYWKRTGPAPVLLTLDAAKRDVCQVKRERTSSPLQALVQLNSPQFVEAARCLSEKTVSEIGRSSDDAEKSIATNLFRKLTSRFPTDEELSVLLTLYQQQLDVFQNDSTAGKELLTVGEFPSTTDRIAEVAAWTTITSMLMNYDECVVKR